MKKFTAWWRRVTGKPTLHSYRDGHPIYYTMLSEGWAYPLDFDFPMPAWVTVDAVEHHRGVRPVTRSGRN